MEFSNDGERETREIQNHVWNHTLSYITSMSLKCVVELGIPEIIHNHGRPMTLPDLVLALGVPRSRAGFLSRLMRIMIQSGFFAQQQVQRSSSNEDGEEKEGYVLASPARLLLKGNPMSMHSMVTIALHRVYTEQFNCLSKWFRNDSPVSPFEMQHGRTYWDYTSHDPELIHIMNEAMASDTITITGKIIEKCKNMFEHSSSVVDVGGRTGLLAREIADAFPHLELTVLDLPHVVCGLEGTKNLKFLAGDMFKYIPPANIILLKWILHDWNDEDAIKILKRSKEAVTAGGQHAGKLIVIEWVMQDLEDYAWKQPELFFDMTLMASVTGKERTEKEWAELFHNAGFSEYKITPLVGSRCLIEVHP